MLLSQQPLSKRDFAGLFASFYRECTGSPRLPRQPEVTLKVFECSRKCFKVKGEHSRLIPFQGHCWDSVKIRSKTKGARNINVQIANNTNLRKYAENVYSCREQNLWQIETKQLKNTLQMCTKKTRSATKSIQSHNQIWYKNLVEIK